MIAFFIGHLSVGGSLVQGGRIRPLACTHKRHHLFQARTAMRENVKGNIHILYLYNISHLRPRNLSRGSHHLFCSAPNTRDTSHGVVGPYSRLVHGLVCARHAAIILFSARLSKLASQQTKPIRHCSAMDGICPVEEN